MNLKTNHWERFLYSFEDESFEPSLVLATSADVSLDMDAEDVGDGGDGLSDDDESLTVPSMVMQILLSVKLTWIS